MSNLVGLGVALRLPALLDVAETATDGMEWCFHVLQGTSHRWRDHLKSPLGSESKSQTH